MTSRTDNRLSSEGLTACHECDRLHTLHPLAPGERAHCTRCGALLYRDVTGALDRCIALSVAALGLFVLANVFPFIALKLEGRIEEAREAADLVEAEVPDRAPQRFYLGDLRVDCGIHEAQDLELRRLLRDLDAQLEIARRTEATRAESLRIINARLRLARRHGASADL